MNVKQIVRDNIHRLRAQRNYWEEYLRDHPEESETLLAATMRLAIEWNDLKIVFWSAVLNEQE